MKSRVVLVIIVVSGALGFWVFRRTGGHVPESLFSTIFIVLGCLGLVSALVLKMGLVKPGVVWGQTPVGVALLGLGGLLMGFGSRYGQAWGTVLEGLVSVVGLLSFISGLRLEGKARLEHGSVREDG